MNPELVLDNFDIFTDTQIGVNKIRGLILDLAVQGRLVAHDPDEGDAAEIPGEAATIRDALISSKLLPAPRKADVNLDIDRPFEVPETWCWTHLGDIAAYIQRGKGPVYSDHPTSVPVVSQKCIQWSGFDLSAARFVEESTLNKYGVERYLQAGDLLWNSTGTGTVGRVAVYPDDLGEQVTVADSHVTVVRLALGNPFYVLAWLSSSYIQERISSLTTGTTKQQELGLSTVRGLAVPLPPLGEQDRIVKKLDELMRMCDGLVRAIEDREQASALFRDSALHALTRVKVLDETEV